MIKVPETNYKDYPGDGDFCFLCGKPVNSKAKMVRVIGGGSMIATTEEAEALIAEDPANEASDLYGKTIGPDCLRRHPEIKPYAR